MTMMLMLLKKILYIFLHFIFCFSFMITHTQYSFINEEKKRERIELKQIHQFM